CMWKWARQKIHPSDRSWFSPFSEMLLSQTAKRAKDNLFCARYFLGDVSEARERKMPGLGVLVEVAEWANVGPQVNDRDMGRVFKIGIDDETKSEVIMEAEAAHFQLVFGALD